MVGDDYDGYQMSDREKMMMMTMMMNDDYVLFIIDYVYDSSAILAHRYLSLKTTPPKGNEKEAQQQGVVRPSFSPSPASQQQHPLILAFVEKSQILLQTLFKVKTTTYVL